MENNDWIEYKCDNCGYTNSSLKECISEKKEVFCNNCKNKFETNPTATNQIWTCRCCETEYQDDFRCISSKNVCMNCCACAFCMSKPDLENEVCTAIQLKDIGTFKNDNDDLPF